MKIQILIEDGAPLLAFSDRENHNKTLEVYSVKEGHSTATRAYLRSLTKPQTEDEILSCWRLLHRYANLHTT